MPLFLCDLAPLLGKDKDTLARWCERGDIIPGAYRTRGGSKRRGKWRVAVPRVDQEDVAFARARARRDGIDLEEYLAMLTLDRLCNRIAQKAKRISRRREPASSVVSSGGLRVKPFDLDRFRSDYAIAAVPLIIAGKDTARAAADALTLQVKGKRSRAGRELSKFGGDFEADPEYALAVAVAAAARRRGKPSDTTLEALAAQFGLTFAQLQRRPALEEKLKRAHRVAQAHAKAVAVKDAPNLDAAEQEDLRRNYNPIRREDYNPEHQLEIQKWIEAMSPDELSETYESAHAPPDVRRMIEAIKKRRARDGG